MTVFMKANAPNRATAENASARSEFFAAEPFDSLLGQEVEMGIIRRSYGTTKDGREVQEYICTNANGYKLEMIDYGALVTALRIPDKNGKFDNVTLSCTDLEGYEACTSYFGCTVGRYCNRIANGKFSIEGKEYTLAANNGEHHLHGGNIGFDKQVWKSKELISPDMVGVRFTLVSADGDEGYPGNLSVTVDYILTNANEFKIDFTATTDKSTVCNLTNHNYWNLGGAGSGKILDHTLQLEANQYVPVDAQGIPTGKIENVEGTLFDFRAAKKIGTDFGKIQSDPVGYDHNYVLKSQNGELALAATVVCGESGRKMEIHTTEPGIQFYTGNFLDGQPGSGGFNQYGALCLETQHYPDSPNQPSFPSTILKPGDTYRHTTVHKFSIQK